MDLGGKRNSLEAEHGSAIDGALCCPNGHGDAVTRISTVSGE